MSITLKGRVNRELHAIHNTPSISQTSDAIDILGQTSTNLTVKLFL
jgi:hypothetical protein